MKNSKRLSLNGLNILKFLRLKSFEKNAIYVLVFVAFVAINLVVGFLPFRLDFSRGKAYTLSDSTTSLLHHLDDLVTLTFYVSSDLPARLTPVKNDVVDFLNEYKKAGGNKIQIKIVDPKKDPKLAEDAQVIGIPELQFSQLDQDKYALANGFFGIGVVYGSKKGAIPQATDLQNLEFDLTSTIYKLTNKKMQTVGMVGDTDLSTGQSKVAALQKVLSQQVDVQSVELGGTGDPLKSVKTLVVFSDPGQKYSDTELQRLNDYLAKGGKAVIFEDGVAVQDNLQVTEKANNLDSVLSHYGLSVKNNLVLSSTAEMVNFGNSQVSFFVPYPFWAKTNVFNQATPYFSNVSQLTYPWTSAVQISKKNGVDYIRLVESTPKSWEQVKDFQLTPQLITTPKENQMKAQLLTAEAKNKKGTDIVLVASSRFADDRFQSQTADNLNFVVNVAGSMASNGALSGIRSRGVNLYPLPELSQTEKDAFKYLNILLLPGLFAAFGLYRFMKRS